MLSLIGQRVAATRAYAIALQKPLFQARSVRIQRLLERSASLVSPLIGQGVGAKWAFGSAVVRIFWRLLRMAPLRRAQAETELWFWTEQCLSNYDALKNAQLRQDGKAFDATLKRYELSARRFWKAFQNTGGIKPS